MIPPWMPKLYLIDATAQLFRAYFAVRGLTNAEGLPTNAIFGFTSMLRKLINEEQPAYIAAAFDLPGEVFRHDSFPEYKANRPPAPEDLNLQLPYVKQVCEVLGVTVIEHERYEADDLIATFTKRARDRGLEVVIVAADKDLLQLVGEGVEVLNPAKELRLDASGVEKHFGVPPTLVCDVLGLMGDAVDNLPGVPGVGEKRAKSIVSTYGDLESVIERAERFVRLFNAREGLLQNPDSASAGRSFSEALQSFVEHEADEGLRRRYGEMEKLLEPGGDPKAVKVLKRELKGMERGSAKKVWFAIREHAEQARLCKKLATLESEVPISLDPMDLESREPDRSRAHELFKSLDFGRLTAEFEPSGSVAARTGSPRETSPAEAYETVLQQERLRSLAEECRRAAGFAIDTETDGLDPMRARLVGISLASAEGRGVYIPIGHDYIGAPGQIPLDRVREVLGPLLADEGLPKIGQNLKFDAHILRRHGMPVRGWGLDTMVAAFLLNSSRSSYSMDSLAEEYLGHTTIKYEDVAGRGAKQITLNQAPIERVTEYAAEDADITLRLANILRPRLESSGLLELYDNIDGPLLPLLERMEAHGIRVDSAMLERMSGEMQASLERAREEIHGLAGTEFNVDSPKQLREVLFDRMGLKPGRKTAKSKVPSTDARTLEELAGKHAIARKLLEYRELAKLKGTYVDSLPRLVNPETGRVHTSYHPTGAATGRLSSSDPNLQNIPVRSEAGRRIRSAFIPEDGHAFLASDYSQVELRVLAHLARDEQLIAAFRAGEDIHSYTASRVFGVAQALVSGDMRRRAKAVNFGILYGMSETRLAREQGMTRADARSFIAAYFERFSKVRSYIDSVREQALRDAAIRTLFGRVRYFPQLHRRVNRAVKEQALRAALNTTIQGTAADLMKMAMLKVEQDLDKEGLEARILLQVHDELLLEVPLEAVERVGSVVRRAMEGVYRLEVPLAVDQKSGQSWLAV
jgi:DNA polymerase-1